MNRGIKMQTTKDAIERRLQVLYKRRDEGKFDDAKDLDELEMLSVRLHFHLYDGGSV
jgi:hypothetical protein